MTPIPLSQILFVDIETVPTHSSFDQLPEPLKLHWQHKISHWDESPTSHYEKAGLYAEFGKIICISIGAVRGEHLKIKSFTASNEKDLLEEFCTILNGLPVDDYYLCGHYAKEFDFPFIARRCLIHQLQVPYLLQTVGKKPWETTHLDLIDFWRFGQYKTNISLALLAELLQLPTNYKQGTTGDEIYQLYYEAQDLKRITQYCEEDVRLTIEAYKRLAGGQT